MASAVALREEIERNASRWRSQLQRIPSLDASTLGMGIAARVISLGSGLIRLMVTELLPNVDPGPKPTVGAYINLLEQHRSEGRLNCSAPDRILLTRPELDALKRFSAKRARLFHQEGDEIDPMRLGRLTPDEARGVVSLVEQIAALPIVSELVCREHGQPRLALADEGMP